MTTAREIMTGGPECIGENQTVLQAAKKLTDLGVGALPICGDDDRLKGMVTDRDIVIRVIAQGRDPKNVKAGSWPRANRSPSAPTTTPSRCCAPWPGTRCAGCPSSTDISSSASWRSPTWPERCRTGRWAT